MTAGDGTIHASAVAIGEKGVLIRGRSGSGKSSLVLALLTLSPEATLVADDRVLVSAESDSVVAAAPEVIAGKLEVRGLGIVRVRHVSPVAVALVVDLLPLDECPRLPEPREREVSLAGIVVPRVFVAIGAADAPFRVLAALSLFQTKSLI
jgi:serine kinase of HPr protein (carbohydrate metabolism regulator)